MEYRLRRVLQVHPDSHNVVRTVIVGIREKDHVRPYVPKALDGHTLGVQRVAVICPIEEQEISVVRRTLLFVALGKHWEHQTYLRSSLKYGEHLLRLIESASNDLILSDIDRTVMWAVGT